MSHPSAVLELNGPQVLGVMKHPQVPLVQEAVRVVTTQLGSQGRFLPSLSRVCDARDRNALTELRRRFPTLSSSNGAVSRGGLVRRHGNVGQSSRGPVIKIDTRQTGCVFKKLDTRQ